MNNFLSVSFWFNTRPGSLSPNILMMLTFFLVALFALFLVFTFLKKRKNGLYFKIISGLSTFFLTNFIVGLFFLFFSYELIPILSARFWYPLWFLGMIFWQVMILKELRKIPEKKKKFEEEKEFQKYIP